MVEDDLPFEAGQLAESKSFTPGYRGAWFRCKIQQIKQKNGGTSMQMEYYDFPDEKLIWTKVYQKPPRDRKEKQTKQLMVRPCFPTVYCRSDSPDATTISEVGVIVNDSWRVGDLVDWWTDYCFWSGTVTKILSDKKLQIELLAPPEGEGSSYEVSWSDLRPSLDWSPKSGWTVPNPITVNGSGQPCAQIIKPVIKGQLFETNELIAYGEDNNIYTGTPMNGSLSSPISKRSLSAPDGPDLAAGLVNTNASQEALKQSGPEKTENLDAYSSSHSSVPPAEMVTPVLAKDGKEDSKCSDILEALICLEGLANHARRLECLLNFGTPYPKAAHSSWKYFEDDVAE